MSEHRIRVVCTDGGQHKLRVLTAVLVDGDAVYISGGLSRNEDRPGAVGRQIQPPALAPVLVEGRWTYPPDPAGDAVWDAGGRWFLTCPSCRRRPTISNRGWKDKWRQVAATGATEVDVSNIGI
ncbi:hypothetical protein [Sporichthya sp.]|uniref:hypothetical protein n=1 Tax=Sporichthya sp. TaxID=65475 RepID=UPI001797C7F6|nr:hypothetical protein [Sporichthya sp.]MBA3742490.1 hypothetical protein [Sporichthya sp.]